MLLDWIVIIGVGYGYVRNPLFYIDLAKTFYNQKIYTLFISSQKHDVAPHRKCLKGDSINE